MTIERALQIKHKAWRAVLSIPIQRRSWLARRVPNAPSAGVKDADASGKAQFRHEKGSLLALGALGALGTGLRRAMDTSAHIPAHGGGEGTMDVS